MTRTRSSNRQGAPVTYLLAAPQASPHPWARVMELLGATERVLQRGGWAAEGSPGLHGPHSLTDALAMAAFPPGQDLADEGAVQLFIAAWEAIARTTWEELGVTPSQFQADASVGQYHVVALVTCTRLRLQVGAADPPH